MRRQRLVGLGIVSFLLLALTLICASASWFIQDRKSQEAAYKDAALGNATATTKSDYFTLDYTYSGAKKVPQLTTAGVTLFGYSTVEGNFEFEWLGGTDKSGNVLTGSTPEKYQGVIAGTHRYKVVEVATGQTIYDNLQITVNKATLTVGSLSASSDPTFVAGTVAYTYQINGVSGHSMEYTDSATVPYDAFTAGASITTSYDGMTAVFDPAKLTLPTLSDSNFTR